MFYNTKYHSLTKPVNDQSLLTLTKKWKNFKTKNWS